MTSARRVAFSLFGVVAACGVVLLFTMTSANGQNSAAPFSPGGNSASGNSATGGAGATGVLVSGPAPTGTPMPSFRRVVGAPPVRRPNTALVDLGDGVGASVDVEGKYVYSLLSQPGSGDYTLILDPRSAARPSFIIEKLIVLYQETGNSDGTTTGTGTTGQSGSSSRGETPGTPTGSQGTGATAPTGTGSYERLLKQVNTYITAELTRGSGRARSAHRTKLLYLNSAVSSLLDIYNPDRFEAIQALVQTDNGKFDVYDYIFAEARSKARQGDDYAPVVF